MNLSEALFAPTSLILAQGGSAEVCSPGFSEAAVDDFFSITSAVLSLVYILIVVAVGIAMCAAHPRNKETVAT